MEIEWTQRRKNKIGYTMAKGGVLGIILTLACSCVYYGYTAWGIIFVCFAVFVGGLMLTNCTDNM